MMSRDADSKKCAGVDEILVRARRLQSRLDETEIADLPHVIIHGDYTPANVLYHDQVIGGIFDFDWVSCQPRLIDIGEALQFFAFKRTRPIDSDSIWSLVQGWEADWKAAHDFLVAYQCLCPLSAKESRYLSRFMQETWIGIHVRAMRKVVSERRLEILLHGTLKALTRLCTASEHIENLVVETRCESGFTA